jgi:methylated-DNA-[protein]-cysteine S-methyltransferase
MNTHFISFKTPLGILKITAEGEFLASVNFASSEGKSAGSLPACLKEAKKQLLEYFDEARKSFSLPLKFPDGISAFRRKIWERMAEIPYGRTESYGDLARRAGSPKAARAAGGACNKNPFMIIIPCHRVVGSGGSLTGYAGGLKAKKFLLDFESGKI